MVSITKIKSWEEATKPFREAAKKAEFTKEDLEKVIEESGLNKGKMTKQFI